MLGKSQNAHGLGIAISEMERLCVCNDERSKLEVRGVYRGRFDALVFIAVVLTNRGQQGSPPHSCRQYRRI
jgi:hypothetical protein